ncbi:MAG: TlpA disulfide reductase family protein [Pseudomonadota bacterium]
MNNKLIIGIAVAAMAIGLGVYGMFGTSGNNTVEIASGNGQGCPASVARGKQLDAAAQGDIAAFRSLDEPLDMTEISFVDAEGKQTNLGEWKGKIVLFNLWATWCPPCREEMPYLEELQETKGGDTFDVVPVSIDLGEASKPKAFYEDTGLKALPFLHDNTMEAFQALKRKAVALGMPTTLLVDRNGCGLGVLNGPAHWASPDAVRLIDTALALPDLNS